ncbi:hypothetical protein MFU01_76990 [Myxococcus fulvus]|uniref:Uncharacterized protein n=1 Tax=Myxococcus fulvus TaxID=33 RepID=A0A511TH22_MYXFU|nr:hypothetical protein MFU01_76990 [Myxococcus fulvus]
MTGGGAFAATSCCADVGASLTGEGRVSGAEAHADNHSPDERNSAVRAEAPGVRGTKLTAESLQ